MRIDVRSDFSCDICGLRWVSSEVVVRASGSLGYVTLRSSLNGVLVAMDLNCGSWFDGGIFFFSFNSLLCFVGWGEGETLIFVNFLTLRVVITVMVTLFFFFAEL